MSGKLCRWCGLVLDPAAPKNGEMVAGNYDGMQQRRVHPHCGNESPTCDWCSSCYDKREKRSRAGLDMDTGKPPGIDPDRMA